MATKIIEQADIDINKMKNIKEKLNIDVHSETINKITFTGQQIQNLEIKENNKGKDKREDPANCKKKYKKYNRRIKKINKLYKEIEKEKNEDLNNYQKYNNDNKSNKCTCSEIILYFAFLIVLCTDFILPIALNFEEDYIEDDDKYEKEESVVGLAVGVILSIVCSVLTSSYTIITIYSTKRRKYITGDFLYDRQINDNISLMKTVQIICGFSFAIVYCNLYFWRTKDKKNVFGKPYLYEQIIIPDYTIKNGISVYMIVKLIIIIVSIIGHLCFSKKSVFKNDLAEYNLICGDSKYDFDNELERINKEKMNSLNYLKSDINKEGKK